MRNEKSGILITGATGCGKSSTINALFNADLAKVGQGSDPETMHIKKYEYGNMDLYDSPGLGDGKEADLRHAKGIADLMHQCDTKGDYIIDLVLVVLDGGSRDLGTTFELINNVIIPNLGKDKSRILVAINQADMAMKGKYWNHKTNQPEIELIKFLDDKVASTRNRIKEATGIDVEPIYYSAGYKNDDEAQNPYNLGKLLLQILTQIKSEKRIVIAAQVNPDETVWKDNGGGTNYPTEIVKITKESLATTLSKNVAAYTAVGAAIGSAIPVVGTAIGTSIGAVVGVVSAIFDWW